MAAFRNIFQSIPLRKPKRNYFDLSFDNLVSLNFGDLVPVMCKEVLPGDTWQVQSSVMTRFAPMIAPIMHRVNVYVHYFFVPNRILWSDFEDFITGGADGQQSPTLPRIQMPNYASASLGGQIINRIGPGTLWDYLGLPPCKRLITEANFDSTYYGLQVNLLPFAAYQKIYQDYYRDQNLEDEENIKDIVDSQSVLLPTTGWTNFDKLTRLQKRAWEKDYFTSALPWPQRGGDVHLPLEGDAPVSASGKVVLDPIGEGPIMYPAQKVRYMDTGGSMGVKTIYTSSNSELSVINDSVYRQVVLDPNSSMRADVEGVADLSEVSATTVNELRRAMRLQEWLEKNARSGARYIEQILSHFGVRSSDGRLDRAEYLGGGKQPVQVSEVLQTSATTDDGPLADMAGHGISVGNSNKFRKFFEEHGWVIGIMSIIPRSSYAGGVPKHFTKFDKFDYAWPEFANLGEQEIMESELQLAGSRDPDTGLSVDSAFGYTPRYAEYKFSLNEFHGDFIDSMSFWHLGRVFNDPSSIPQLTNNFIKVRPTADDLNRIFAVQDNGSHLWCEVFNKITVKRTLPKFGVPTL